MGCRAVGVKGQNQGTSCFYLQIRYGTTSNVIVMILTRQRTTVGWEKRVEWDFLGHSNISWKLGPVKINSRKLWRKRNTKIHISLFSIGLNICENSFSQNRKKIRGKPRNYLFPLPETVSLHYFTFFWLMLLQSFNRIFDTSEPEQPLSQALRFWQGRGERMVMNRKGPWRGYSSSLPPSFARTLSERERDLGTRQEPEQFLFDP